MSRVPTLTAIVAAALVAAIGAPSAGSGPAAAKVRVTLAEFTLTPSARSVSGGSVTFVVRNAGKLAHELVVLKTTRRAGKLPIKGMEAVETGKVGGVAAIAPRATKSLTLRLKPGHYALICNIPGHYKAGQFADLTVR